MKLKTLLTPMLFIVFVCGVYSQTENCDAIKKQNDSLKAKLKQYGLSIDKSPVVVKSFSSDIAINFIKCIGDSKNQTVTLYFNAVNPNLPNQAFYLNGSTDHLIPVQAFSEIGEAFKADAASLGVMQSNSFGIVTSLTTKLTTGDFPVMGTVTFINVLPSVKEFKEIDVYMKNDNFTGGTGSDNNRGTTEFKYVPISWK